MGISSEWTKLYGQPRNRCLSVCFDLLPDNDKELERRLQAEYQEVVSEIAACLEPCLLATSPLDGETSSPMEGLTSNLPHCNSW